MPNYRRMTRRAAVRNGIDPDIFERQIGAESNFDPNARSPAGAGGIAQIMPATAQGWGVDPYKPKQALNAAARAMSGYLRDYKGDWSKALAAYNAGPGAVAKYGGVPPYTETQNYVKKILAGRNPRSSRPRANSTRTTPGIDNSAMRQQIMLDYLESRDHPDALLNLGLGLRGAQDVPGSISSTTTGGLNSAGRNSRVLAGNGVPVNDMLRKAVKWDRAKAPYLWGGGHARIAKPGEPVDCSGYVSAVLGLERPMVSGEFMKWGKPGKGRNVTVYANSGHVLMAIRDPRTGKARWFGTSKSNPGGGAGEIAPPSADYLSRFVARHPG